MSYRNQWLILCVIGIRWWILRLQYLSLIQLFIYYYSFIYLFLFGCLLTFLVTYSSMHDQLFIRSFVRLFVRSFVYLLSISYLVSNIYTVFIFFLNYIHVIFLWWMTMRTSCCNWVHTAKQTANQTMVLKLSISKLSCYDRNDVSLNIKMEHSVLWWCSSTMESKELFI